MGISQYKVEAKVNPQIIAAVIAAVLQYEHDEQPGEIIIEKQYIQQKIKGGRIYACKKIVGVYRVLGINFHQQLKLKLKNQKE